MKTILLPYHDEEAGRSALASALLIAKRFDSYLEGLMAVPSPLAALGRDRLMPGNVLAHAVEMWRQIANEAQEHFLMIAAEHGLPVRSVETVAGTASVGWHEADGHESETVGSYGRLFDLIVLGRTTTTPTAAWRETCEAALFETGRPVLVAPVKAPETVGRIVVIPWNGSTEGARALGLARPLLQAAEVVHLVTVDEAGVFGPDGVRMAKHLIQNGVRAQAHTISADGRPSGEAILDEAGTVNADLIVKGAFTRHRIRQIIFGGVTQHLLDHSRLPLLLAH